MLLKRIFYNAYGGISYEIEPANYKSNKKMLVFLLTLNGISKHNQSFYDFPQNNVPER